MSGRGNGVRGFVGFGVLLGVWLSTFIVFYVGVDMLIFVSILGGGVCFLGFVHYWCRSNGYGGKVKGVKKEKNQGGGLVDRVRFWDGGD